MAASCMRFNQSTALGRGAVGSRVAPSSLAAPRHIASAQQQRRSRHQWQTGGISGRRLLQQQQQQQQHLPRAESGGGAAALPPDDASGSKPPLSLLQRIKRFFVGDGLDRERLKALGMGAFASYGFISNLNYGTALTIAWVAFVKKYGKSPLAEGQWPAFLAFYAGLWALQNFARPLRLSLAIALAPAFDRAIEATAGRFGVTKGKGFGIFLAGMAVVTSATMFSALYLLGGFPK